MTHHRHASALILIMAILVMVVIIAFGILAFVSDQRGWSRLKHEDAIMRQTLLSGRAHAQMVLEKNYADNAATVTQLSGQAWITAFAGSDAIDLWRFEPGLASPSPAVAGSPHGYNDGYCSHPGTGRWFTVAWLDRDLNPVEASKASLQLRYAIAPIDLSGLLLANKARYEHFDPGATTATYRRGASEAAATVGAITTGDIFVTTESFPPVPLSGTYPNGTDRALGRSDATWGTDALRYNTWRPIPADHAFSAHMLMTIGMGLDDSRPRTLADSFANPNGTSKTVAGKTSLYYTRVKGNLPDIWRHQSYAAVKLAYWQYSERFRDYLPFDQNPHPPVLGSESGNEGWKTNYWGGSTTRPTTLPSIANRHPLALLFTLQTDPTSLSSASSTAALDTTARWLNDIWNQIDHINWWGMQQGLRLHQINTGSSLATGLPNPPSGANGLTECWSPYGSTVGRFGTGASRTVTVKNEQEMAYQWTPDINTAPRQVLRSIVRLAVPSDSASPSNSAESDDTTYSAFIDDIVAKIIAGRPYLTQTDVKNGYLTWSSDAATQEMLRNCCYGSGATPGPTPGSGPMAQFKVKSSGWDGATGLDYVVVAGRHLNRFWTNKIAGATDNGDSVYRMLFFPGPTVRYVQLTGTNRGAQYYDSATSTASASGSDTRIWLQGGPSSLPGSSSIAYIHHPGITFSIGNSRWFRVAVRAELTDLDVPEASRSTSMDMVVHLDPDLSGSSSGTKLWDSDIPYCDLENDVQWRVGNYGGNLVW